MSKKSTNSKASPRKKAVTIPPSPSERIKEGTKKLIVKKWFSPLLIFLATIVYFMPIAIRINSYIPGGDAMFNAWVMARNQNCILRQHCDTYTNANIYYPNKDTMLYSEVEIAPSVVTLPLRLITQNPIFAYNVITIASFFMAGFSMYLLAMYLTRGNKFFSLLIGLFFEFSPIMLAATHNLQSLSIFCLPLAALWVMKFLDDQRRRYLVYLFLTLLYVFYASWYQMIFMLITLGILILGMGLLKLAKLKPLAIVSAVIACAVIATLPLAMQYVRFSKQNKATYLLQEKVANSASVIDYIVPPYNSALGKVYLKLVPSDTWHPNTLSYSGISICMLILFAILYAWRKRGLSDRSMKFGLIYGVIGLIGIVGSLGPLLKLAGEHVYKASGQDFVIPLPFYFIHRYLPLLGFLRTLGRFSVLFMFALCCVIAAVTVKLAQNKFYKEHKIVINAIVLLIVFIDLMPFGMYTRDANKHAYFPDVPKVYKYIKDHPNIDNIIVLQAKDYPGVNFWFARTEVVLWAGYHNRNVFNGYSGYIPPTYETDYSDFVNMEQDDPAQMKKMGIDYVVVDKELYTNKPSTVKNIPNILKSKPLYSDSRYDLYKLGS